MKRIHFRKITEAETGEMINLTLWACLHGKFLTVILVPLKKDFSQNNTHFSSTGRVPTWGCECYGSISTFVLTYTLKLQGEKKIY